MRPIAAATRPSSLSVSSYPRVERPTRPPSRPVQVDTKEEEERVEDSGSVDRGAEGGPEGVRKKGEREKKNNWFSV